MTESREHPTLALVVGRSRFSLRDGHRYHVGRGPLCDLRIGHASLAESHALVQYRGGVVSLADLGSPMGTFVDGVRVRKTTVRPGQTLRFGAIDVELTVESGAAVAAVGQPMRAAERFREPPFTELMAHELKRTPWFTLSALIHLILFFILYALLDQPTGAPRKHAKLTLGDGMVTEEFRDFASPHDAEIREEQEVIEEIVDPFDDPIDSGSADEAGDPLELGPSALARGLHWMQEVKPDGGSGILRSAKVRAGGFGKRISEIRRSGLEIVFVFDSTATMGELIHNTKRRIAHMLEVLHALVPDARMGVVTYRDRGPSEDYLTRSVSLSHNVHRAINFMQVIDAQGGDDRPEAVLDGLREAINQSWHRKARRVVVLIGDAPAYAYDDKRISRLVKDFVADGQSFVHAIVVSDYGGGVLPDDTRKSFRRIAEQGKGECIGFENESLVLRQVLSLAFGREYRANIDEVARIIESNARTVDAATLDLLRREDKTELDNKLREDPIPDEVVAALARSQSKGVARHLVDLLEDPEFPESGRQAVAYALSRILNRSLEPAMQLIFESARHEGEDPRRQPWSLGVVSRREARYLRDLIDDA